MRQTLRSVAKRVFYAVLPALRPFWFALKVVEYFVLDPLLSLLPLRWAHRIHQVRWPWLVLMPSEKELILRNLSTAFPGRLSESALNRTGAAYARFLSSLRFDSWIASSSDVKKLNQGVCFEGFEHLQEAQKKGKGVVLLGSHSGFFYRFVFALARNGYAHRVITMKTEETGRILWRGKAELMLYEKILQRMERDENIGVIYAGRAGREIAASLEEKRILLTKMDNPAPEEGDKGVRVEFLGQVCQVSGEIFRMARQHDAACLPYIVRVDDPFCHIRLYPPWDPATPEIPEEDWIRSQVEYFLRLFEEHILVFPEQWWLWRDLGAFALPARRDPANP